MAKIEHVKALLSSHLNGDSERFLTIANLIKAHEASKGNSQSAYDIERILSAQRKTSNRSERTASAIVRIPQKIAGLLEEVQTDIFFADMVLEKETQAKLNRIKLEQEHAEKIYSYGLQPKRKILLTGEPGTGKSMTASALANELGMNLFRAKLDGIFGSLMGESGARMRQIFDLTEQMPGVYFFDEFDALGASRTGRNDVGEARRILNSVLMMIENDMSRSLIVCATNTPEILDRALFRRFDEIVEYKMPNRAAAEKMLRMKLDSETADIYDWKNIAEKCSNLSFADIEAACSEVLIDAIVGETETADDDAVIAKLEFFAHRTSANFC